MEKIMKIVSALLFFLLLLLPTSALAAGLEQLAGVWRPDLEATAVEFAMPADLKRDLQDVTITITAAASGQDGKLLLEWKDGASQTRALKLVSQKEKVLKVKIDGKDDLEVDISVTDTLVLREEPNKLILKRVAVER